MVQLQHHGLRRELAARLLVTTLCWMIAWAPAISTRIWAEDANTNMSWAGNWNNRKYNTNGPLKCVASPKDAKTWNAVFEGTGIGKPFKYDVTLQAMKKGNRTLLEGTSTIDGDVYRWTGYIEGGALHGKYRSASGNNGEFKLQQAAS